MAGHVFKITELSRQANGTFTDTAISFQWNATGQSSPRDAWEYGVKMRTHREDYPGSDQPTEQILGPNFTSFTVRGVWLDRYNSQGFADTTRQQFEALVQRGNFCRIEIDNISIIGLITEVHFKYKRQYEIGYEFTFSPHYRNSGGDARRQLVPNPQATNNPQDYADQAAQLALSMRALQLAAPVTFISGTGNAANIAASVDTMIDAVNNTQLILNNRVLVTNSSDSSVSSIARLAQSFVTIQNAADAILVLCGQTSSTAGLDYETAILTLTFEAWQRELAATARMMIFAASQAAYNLSQLVTPNALAFYRPYQGESLYSVSNRFYNTPTRWRDIYTANNLVSFTMQGTELLMIPSGSNGS